MRHDGGKLIALGAGLGLFVSTWNYIMPTGLFAPLSSVAGTPGAALMIFSTLCLLLAGIVLAGHRRGGFLIFFLLAGSLIAILGTGLAGWLLDSPLLTGLMTLSGVGWLLRVFTEPDPTLAKT